MADSDQRRDGPSSSKVEQDVCFTNYASVTSRAFAISLIMEFVGTLIFTFLGTTVDDKILGPFVNGLALAIVIYMAANISGGHINPAVTFSTFICGYYPLLHSAVYVIMQVVGAICGSLLVNSLTPYTTIYVGMGDGGPGCFDQKSINHDISKSQIFGWEVVMTFTLISTVYACGIAKPGHGSMTPLAVGFSLIACAGAGGKYTGAALNPARVLGPLAVYKCGKDVAAIYILAELLAALLACIIFSVVSGWGPLFPFKSMKTFDMTWDESLYMFLTGQPPKRFRQNGDENVHSLRAVLRNPKSFMGRATSKLRKSRKSTDSVEEESHSPDAKSVDHMV